MGISQKDVKQGASTIKELDRVTKLRAASAALSFFRQLTQLLLQALLQRRIIKFKSGIG